MIIDASNLLLGRLATVVAKKALLGETVDIVNCDKIYVSGNKDFWLERFKQKKDLGTPFNGPYISKMPDRLVRRSIRGMLPWKTTRGRDAFKRIQCHIGVPDKFKDQKYETVTGANISKLPNMKYVTIKDICTKLGAKL